MQRSLLILLFSLLIGILYFLADVLFDSNPEEQKRKAQEIRDEEQEIQDRIHSSDSKYYHEPLNRYWHMVREDEDKKRKL